MNTMTLLLLFLYYGFYLDYAHVLWCECLCPLPPKSCAEILTAKMMVLGGGAVVSREGGFVSHGISALKKEVPRDLWPPLLL